MKPTPAPGQTRRRRGPLRVIGRIALWATLVPVGLLAIVYVALLFAPIPLPFVRDQARAAVMGALPASSQLELGDMALALEGGTWPVLQFSPVVFTDAKSGARVRMDALEVGFSPVRAIVGQPGVTVTVVGPRIQVNQDLFGPRVANFEIEPDPAGGRPTVRVLEGLDAFPSLDISPEGLEIQGTLPAGDGPMMRSDNDWLIYNIEAAGKGLADIVEQGKLGRFSRLIVRDGTLEMNDALYGMFRTFTDIRLDITPSPDGSTATGSFSANFGGEIMSGNVERTAAPDGTARLKADITNFAFASFLPFIDDREQVIAVEGAGAVSIDVGFAATDGSLTDGIFRIDMTGTDLRIQRDYFPIASSIIEVDWDPKAGKFTMDESELSIGQSTGKVAGVFVLGLDNTYGPTVAVKMSGRDVSIHPNDMAAPQTPFTSMEFSGWSAPLYGATGIDLFRAEKPDAWLETTGRADMVRKGMGFDMTVVGEGVTADDLKRLWPYFISGETRDWFVENISTGRIVRSTMRYNFPVGTIGTETEQPLPPNSMSIDMVAEGVQFRPVETMDPIKIEGNTRLWVRDTKVTLSADAATVPTDGGDIGFANAALVMGGGAPGENLIEISGDISGKIPAILAFAEKQQPGAIDPASIPLDLKALAGSVALTLVSTIKLDAAGEMASLDYAINGTVTDFGSTEPIETHTITGGQLSFAASQAGYRLAGQAKVDGLDADVVVEGVGDAPPTMLLSSTLDIDDLKSVGFDTSEFLSGQVKFVGKPMPDGTIQLAVDITDAALNIKDLGISKAKGVAGELQAQVKQTGTLTELTRVKLAFGDVKLEGGLDYDLEEGLVSADFTSFALSPGDVAQIALTPIANGYQIKLRGEQFDLKPMLKRFFNLGEGSGGPQATVFTQTIVLDAQLKQALGFYKATAFNLDLNLTLKGTDLQKVSLQTQLGNGNGVSVTTNPGPRGKVMSVAFNDLGEVLRLLGVYGNVQGGEGSLVLQTIDAEKADVGLFTLRNFAIVDEAHVADIVNTHQPSRAAGNLQFRSGKVEFVRRKDRVEVTEGVLTGDNIGGTMRGFIYTDKRAYDLTGTYIPLFGLNNMWQKMPILGPLLGGREGEGLFGVTFKVQGPLDQPDFRINPLSALVPGAFRSLFEFRAKEQPRVE